MQGYGQVGEDVPDNSLLDAKGAPRQCTIHSFIECKLICHNDSSKTVLAKAVDLPTRFVYSTRPTLIFSTHHAA
eukprot:scaffold1280_cov379-Prasinococcus_capsulatus_cf.AAC.3